MGSPSRKPWRASENRRYTSPETSSTAGGGESGAASAESGDDALALLRRMGSRAGLGDDHAAPRGAVALGAEHLKVLREIREELAALRGIG